MSDESRDIDVGALLSSIRHKAAEEQDAGLVVDTTDTIRRLRDRAAERVAAGRGSPSVGDLLKGVWSRVEELDTAVRFHDVGTVQNVGDGVARISGLPNVRTDELVVFPTGVRGLVLSLDHERCDVVMLGPDEGIHGGDLVTRVGERLRVPVGLDLLGRVIDPMGSPLDERGAVDAAEHWFVERAAPRIINRAPVREPLHTGWRVIDALLPIGRGQRELILGDRQTGKTTLAVDAILSQMHAEVACVYVSIGQKKSSTLSVIELLERTGALEQTLVVVSGPDDQPALRYLAPYSGCTIAEYLVQSGRDVLIVYDDLTRHANAYRELSLLLRRPPGREAYPGDVFYLHARLLERACKLREEDGGGSLTALPIVETQQGNMSAYIATNVISITDGQILLDSELFNRGYQPAVDTNRSVSRVGGAAQPDAMRKVVRNLRLELAQYEEVERFARFGTEVDPSTRQQIRRGERLRAMLSQPPHDPVSLSSQIVALLAGLEGYLDDIDVSAVLRFLTDLRGHMRDAHPGLMQQVDRTGELDDETRRILVGSIADYQARWLDEDHERQGIKGDG